MPKGHDHDVRADNKAKLNASWLKNQKSRATAEGNAPDDARLLKKAKRAGAKQSLALSKIFKSALATKVMLSNAEANAIVEGIMKENNAAQTDDKALTDWV